MAMEQNYNTTNRAGEKVEVRHYDTPSGKERITVEADGRTYNVLKIEKR